MTAQEFLKEHPEFIGDDGDVKDACVFADAFRAASEMDRQLAELAEANLALREQLNGRKRKRKARTAHVGS